MKNRIILAVILLIFLSPLKAESPPLNRLSKKASSKDIRFMIGLKGGINFVQPVVTKKFNIFNPIDGDIVQSGAKGYRPFYSNPGYQYAFTALYKLSSKTFSVQSGAKGYRPFYSNPGYQYAFTALYKLSSKTFSGYALISRQLYVCL